MEKIGKILIVDDDPLVLEALQESFIDDYEVLAASSGEEAIELFEQNSDIETIILDIKMAKMDGLKTATHLKDINNQIPIIFHTGYPGDYSEKEIEEGYQPFDYVGKNERPARLSRAVKNAVAFYKLKSSSRHLIKYARDHYGIVGKSQLMTEIYQTIEKIGPSGNKVMILGPTGSGKELVARAIHKRSKRAENPLVIFNCNHKAPDLVESELFGHLKGSFTGAISDRIGLFEYADGGTIFLDEIGDLDITTQGKILRVLETGEMHRIGSPEVIKVDVRLICATHHNLVEMVQNHQFREDLYYRLKGVTIILPSLKERREDIPDLIDYFTEKYCHKIGNGLKVFEPDARECLLEYSWPGNIRQLLDTVQSLIDLTPSYYITKEEVQSYLNFTLADKGDDSAFRNRVKDYKKILILKALDKNKNNISASARELALDPSNLRKLIKELDITVG